MRYHTFYSREALENLITSPEGCRVGWELQTDMPGVMWKWARLVRDGRQAVRYCEFVRAATREEAMLLSHLLKGDIVVRYQGVMRGNPWAFASVD